jgi:hypothetical protein
MSAWQKMAGCVLILGASETRRRSAQNVTSGIATDMHSTRNTIFPNLRRDLLTARSPTAGIRYEGPRGDVRVDKPTVDPAGASANTYYLGIDGK